MYKLIGSVALGVLFATSVATAQVYSAGCISLSGNLSIGSRSGEVRTLQTFLVAQNYPGGGSWMITGYFGQATAAAVRNFQTSAGLPVTGVVDSQTRAAIGTRSCGGAYWNNTYNNTYIAPTTTYVPPTTYTYPNNYTYTPPPTYTNPTYVNPFTPYPTGYPSGSLTLTSLSQNTGTPGTSVTVYGSGFDSYNTVYLGAQIVAQVGSSNGTSLTFNVPQYASYGTTYIKVSNARGGSNTLAFDVVSSNNVCSGNYYNASSCGCSSIYSTTCTDGHLGTPVVNSISPVSGGVSAVVTIYGSGFTATNNTIHFGTGIIANLSSQDGRGLTFTVPTTLTGYGSQQVALGGYPVSVTNGRGENSNSVTFTVTSVAGSTAAPTISNVTGPNTVNVGQQGTWSITLSAPSGTAVTTSVQWGDQSTYGAQYTPQSTYFSSGQQTLTFTHSYQTAGTYTITFSVTGANGSNSSTATVTVGGGASNVSIAALAPQSGRVGSTVSLNGTGFNGDNMVHFGIGGTRSLTSASGSYINFTIPQYISPCDLVVNSYSCGAPAQLVTTGTYPLYITNTNGTSNVLYFTVTP